MAEDIKDIVRKLVAKGETEENIQIVIDAYKGSSIPEKQDGGVTRSDGSTPLISESARTPSEPVAPEPIQLNYQSSLGLSNPQQGLGSSLTAPATQERLTEHAIEGDEWVPGQSAGLTNAVDAYQEANPDSSITEGRSQGIIDHPTTETGLQRNIGRAKFVYNNLLSGLGSIASGGIDVIMQIPTGQNSGMASTRVNPVDNIMLKEYREEYAPEIRESLVNTIGAEMTDQERTRWQGEFVTGSIGGLAASIPAMLGGSARTGMFFLQSYDGAMADITANDTDGLISEQNKTLYAATVGAVNAKLETLSFDRIFKGKTSALAQEIAKEVIEDAGKKGTKVTSEVISKGINDRIGKLANKFSKTGTKIIDAVETESWTEGAQELSNTGFQGITNVLSGEDIFDIDSPSAIIGNTLYAAGQGGVGGGILGGVASLMPTKTKAKIEENAKAIKEIDDFLDTQDADANPEVVEAAVKQKIKIQNEIESEETSNAKKVEGLSKTDLEKAQSLNEQIEKAQAVLDDPNVPAVVKRGVQEDFNKASEALEALLEKEKAIKVLDSMIKKEEEHIANPEPKPEPVNTPPKKPKAPVQEKEVFSESEQPKKVNKKDVKDTDVPNMPDGTDTNVASKPERPKGEQPRAIRPLRETLQNVFGLSKEQADASAKVYDRVMGNIAKRTGQSKTEAYEAVKFIKADPETQEKIKKAKTPEEARKVLEDALFQMVGPKSVENKPPENSQLATAQQMEADGKTKSQIWQETGWENTDNGWQMEIKDGIVKDFNKAKEKITKVPMLKKIARSNFFKAGKLTDIFDAPEVYDFYPELKDVTIESFASDNSGSFGLYDPDTKTMYLNRKSDIFKGEGDPKLLRDTIVHELQHGIQSLEGIDNGSNFAKAEQQLLGKYNDEIQKAFRQRMDNREFDEFAHEYIAKKEGVSEWDEAVFNQYQSNIGETDARNVQDRLDLPQWQREELMFSDTESFPNKRKNTSLDRFKDALTRYQQFQGAVRLYEDGDAIIYALTDPNVSTPMHELAHVYEKHMTPEEIKATEEWSGHKSGTVEFSEAFAEGFEAYLQEGKAPYRSRMQEVFDNFREWLQGIYDGIARKELNKDMRRVYDAMLGFKPKPLTRTEKALEDDPRDWKEAVLQQLFAGSPISTLSFVDRTGFGWLHKENGRTQRATKQENRDIISGKIDPKENGFVVSRELHEAKLKGHVKDDGKSLEFYLEDFNDLDYDEGEMMDFVVQNINEGRLLDKLETYQESLDPSENNEMLDQYLESPFVTDKFTKEEVSIIRQYLEGNSIYIDNFNQAIDDFIATKEQAGTYPDNISQSDIDNDPELTLFIQNNGQSTVQAESGGISTETDNKRTEKKKRSERQESAASTILFQGEQEGTVNKETGIESKTYIEAVHIVMDSMENDLSGYMGIMNARQFLREKGIPTTQINKFTKNVKKQLSDAGIDVSKRKYDQNPEIEVPEFKNDPKKGFAENLIDHIRKGKKKWFNFRGNMRKDFYALKEKAIGATNWRVREASILSGTLKELVKKNKDVSWKTIDAGLRGDQSALDQLPHNIADVVVRMRANIDSLSQLLIDDGVVFGETAETVENNLGTYLHRSYMLHDNKNWKLKNIPDNIINKAKETFYRMEFDRVHNRILREERNSLTDAEKKEMRLVKGKDKLRDFNNMVMEQAKAEAMVVAENKVKEMFDKAPSPFGKGNNVNSTDTNILKHRDTDIPVEIRALMGEYTDPLSNYVKTVASMASLHASSTYLTKVRDIGLNDIFFEQNNKKGHHVKIVNEGSGSLNPLNGLYTTPEIAKEFSAVEPQINDVWKWVMRRSSEVKAMKTIYSVATHIKNIEGNIGFVLVNGHFNISQAKDAGKAFAAEWGGVDNKAFQEMVKPLIENNVLGQNVVTAELRALVGEDAFNYFQRNIDGPSQQMPATGVRGKLRKLKNKVLGPISETAEKAYEMEDAFFKIYGYLNDLNRYSDALYGKKFKQLDGSERQAMIDYAAELTKNSYATYSRMPKIIKKISMMPFGNFIGFASESYRIAYNSVTRAIQEIKSDNPKIRAIGAQRMAGIITYKGLKIGLQYAIGKAGVGALVGAIFDDDEETQMLDDARRFVAPWSKNSDILVYPGTGGEMEYFDFSSYDPFGMQESIINAIWNADSPLDGVKDAGMSIIEPFTDEDLFVGTFLKLKENKNHYGGNIWEIDDTGLEKTLKGLKFTGEAFAPGTYSSLKRIYLKDGKLTDLAYRNYKINLTDAYRYKVRDVNEQITAANRRMRKAERDFDKNSKKYKDTEKRTQEYIEQHMEILREDYEAALRLGADASDLDAEMKNQRMNKSRRRWIRNGKSRMEDD